MHGDIKLLEVRTEIPRSPKLVRRPGWHFLNQKPQEIKETGNEKE